MFLSHSLSEHADSKQQFDNNVFGIQYRAETASSPFDFRQEEGL